MSWAELFERADEAEITVAEIRRALADCRRDE